MNNDLAEEIIACLPRGRTLYSYHKDRYAALLLAHQLGDETHKVAALKQTPYARLLEKPIIKTMLANAGDGLVSAERLNMVWDDPALVFILTLSTWGNKDYDTYYQTSRAGYNLVLQMNFTNKHEREFERLVEPHCSSAFNTSYHPVLMPGDREFFRETLAWARIDLDFDTNEALIEEIQSDWIREARDVLKEIIREGEENAKHHEHFSYLGSDLQHLRQYVDEILQPYEAVWAEAMLWAAVQFIWDELGINTVYYHSYDTGCAVKHCTPPRSLYTSLPRKFCFQKTITPPSFLVKEKTFRKALKKVDNPYFYQLRLGDAHA